MTKAKTAKMTSILNELKNEKINTWFDLGLFIDKFKDQNSKSEFKGDPNSFDVNLEKGGIAFLTFYFTIDGITVETEKLKSMPKPLKTYIQISLYTLLLEKLKRRLMS